MDTQDKDSKFLIEHQAKTAGVAGEQLLKVIGNMDNLFLLSDKPEDMQKNDEAYTNLLEKTLEIFTENKVALTNYAFVFKGVKSIIDALEQHMNNHSSNLQKEINSRVIGAKNPLDGKYDANHATHEDLIQTVLRLREAQGNVPGAEDYFTIVKASEAVEELSTKEEDK